MPSDSIPPTQRSVSIEEVPAALEKRFPGGPRGVERATRAFMLFSRAVRAFKASEAGRISTRTADLAVAEFCDYVRAAASPRRLVLGLRGRR